MEASNPEREARRYPRFVVDALVDVTASEVLLYHRIQNISLGGICIQSPTAEEVGSRVELVLNVPDGEEGGALGGLERAQGAVGGGEGGHAGVVEVALVPAPGELGGGEVVDEAPARRLLEVERGDEAARAPQDVVGEEVAVDDALGE